MKQNLFFVLIAVAVLYLIYSYSKNTSVKKNTSTTKQVKESFQVDYGLIGELADDILTEPINIEDLPSHWRGLNSNLRDRNSTLRGQIDDLKEDLDTVIEEIRKITGSNNGLIGSIADFTSNNSNLRDFITGKSGCQDGNNPNYGISDCGDIFDLGKMQVYKVALNTAFDGLISNINDLLVHKSYDEIDISISIPMNSNVDILDIATIQGILARINNVRSRYNHFFTELTKLPSHSNLDTEGWSDTANNIMATAQSNCENKQDTCIYTGSNNEGGIEYFSSNAEHVFHHNLWPSETSCEKDPYDKCTFKDGMLSDGACSNLETCYDLISNPVNSNETNHSNKSGQIAYKSGSYGYTSTQLSNDDGLTDRWNCVFNYPDSNSTASIAACKKANAVQGTAQSNCEMNPDGSSWESLPTIATQTRILTK